MKSTVHSPQSTVHSPNWKPRATTHLLSAFCILHSAFCLLHSPAATVSFPISNLTSSAATNRSVLVIPLQLTPDTGQVAAYDRLAYNTGTNGTFTISNMVPGLYRITIQAPPDPTSISILVPTNGTVTADTLIVATPQTVARPQDYAYSTTASDARYSPVGAGGLAFVPQYGTGTLTNWAALDTNAIAITSSNLAQSVSSAGLIALSNNLSGLISSNSAGVSSFNSRTGAVSLTSADVTDALGYTPGTGTGQTNWPLSAITNSEPYNIPFADTNGKLTEDSDFYYQPDSQQLSVVTLDAATVYGDILSGTFVGQLDVTNYAAGVGASASTFLRGDGTWAEPTASASDLWTSAGGTIYPSGSTGTGDGWTSADGMIYPE